MAHELSSENLRRVVPGGLHDKFQILHGFFGIRVNGFLAGKWTLLVARLHRGQRRVILRAHLWPEDNRGRAFLCLGTISTVAELREWYQRLGGKGWE